MEIVSSRRYPSLAMAAEDGATTISIDGMEVIDEQVVALTPRRPRPLDGRES
ncbi:hypothetical protein ACFQRL_11290 [Microbacterium fluvii]|uniref:Uncharacterized protein n=1 Tax=Microbacterium fluvii TaxID=415215 RepID=A0ABW2HEN1_9MICO|nr:hypothetical protein [Microbacterium fluvii]MCU4673179.1 hypothetical protein [Microbacterium fluvii]